MQANATEIIIDLVAAALEKDTRSVSEEDVRQIGPTLAYVDPVMDPPPSAAVTTAIAPWGGFPRAVKRGAPWTELPHDVDDPTGVYRAVEHLGEEDHRPGVFIDKDDNILHLPVRDRQDEYLELIG